MCNYHHKYTSIDSSMYDLWCQHMKWRVSAKNRTLPTKLASEKLTRMIWNEWSISLVVDMQRDATTVKRTAPKSTSKQRIEYQVISRYTKAGHWLQSNVLGTLYLHLRQCSNISTYMFTPCLECQYNDRVVLVDR